MDEGRSTTVDGRGFLVVDGDGFVDRFRVGPDADLDLLQDEDVHVTLTGGPTHYVNLMTLDAIAAVLRRWERSGEAAGGRYFHASDLVVVPRPGLTAMLDAIDGLVRDGRSPPPARSSPTRDSTRRLPHATRVTGWRPLPGSR